MSRLEDAAVDVSQLPELLLPEEAARFLRLDSVRTLRNWRSLGTGPDYVKNGRRVLYPREALAAWLKAHPTGRP